jgi:hypothetical protein
MVTKKYVNWAVLVLVFLCLVANSFSQSKKKKDPTREPQSTLNSRLAQSRADVVLKAKEYKASLNPVLVFEENDVKALTEKIEKQKVLLAEGIIAKKELDKSEQDLSAAQAKVTDTKKQIADTDNLIAEASSERQLEKLGKSKLGAYQVTAALIRYNGPAHWILSDASKVEGFFASRFKHTLPISAFGQTAVHDQLGFDHHNAMDVALSPDSTEGKALMDYLRGQGIPFIAFHYAVRGSATGAHIHVGSPSHRLGK